MFQDKIRLLQDDLESERELRARVRKKLEAGCYVFFLFNVHHRRHTFALRKPSQTFCRNKLDLINSNREKFFFTNITSIFVFGK